jgi:hypothetical protein
MRSSRVLELIRRLDPERDHQRIAYLFACYEFPFDLNRALEFALFRTFAVPSISALLDRSGEFHARPQKRYDDTAILVSTFYSYGYDSSVGRAALRQMNRQHHRWPIANDDYLYVLSTFVFEPLRWIDRYAYRPTVEQERLANFHLWRAIARRMNIHDIPSDYAAFERFNREYECANFRYSESNRRVGMATVRLFLSWFLPEPLRPLGAPLVYAMMDDLLLASFGFPRPPAALQKLVQGTLRLRGRLVRQLPARTAPFFYPHQCHRSYPDGFTIEQLGPPGQAGPGTP